MQAGMDFAEAVGPAIGTGTGAALIGGLWLGRFFILEIFVLVTDPTSGGLIMRKMILAIGVAIFFWGFLWDFRSRIF